MPKKINIIIILLISFLIPVNAEELNLNSEKYILYNLDNDSVLLEKQSNEKTSIASLTKIMSVIVAIEKIDDYDKKVTITNDMIKDIEWDVAKTGFKVGDKVTYDDLLYSAIVASGADSVNALAISLSGSLEDYVTLMNKKAKELNMNDTHFTNVIGLYDINHYSTAEDMAKLLKYALKNNKFKEIFEAEYYITSNNKKLRSTISKYNNDKNDISFITGAKTGYLSKSGNCLASTSHISGVNYLLITLNSYKGSTSHIEDAVKVYKYFGNKYENKKIVGKEDIVVTLKTKCSKEKEIGIKANKNITKFMEKDISKDKISYIYDGIEKVSYFTKKGTKLGTIKIMYNNNELESFDLIYNEVLTFSLLAFIWNYKIIIILLIFSFIIIKSKKPKRKRKHK